MNPGILIEVLTPDFMDDNAAIDTVLAARPEIFNHNLETIRGLTPKVRSVATYDRSLSVLRKVKERSPETFTKSGIMLGLGETEELQEALVDLARLDVTCSRWANICNPLRNICRWWNSFIRTNSQTQANR